MKKRQPKPRPPVRQRLRRGAYLLPSLFTIGNIILGFAAVIRAYRGDFETAAVMVFIAGVLDTLDGRIARLTGTESEFGKEFDSLADVLTFGIVPALLAFFWGLEDLGRLGWLVPLYYLVCTAIRLARFNVVAYSDKRFFVGMPSPAAAGSIGSILFIAPDIHAYPWLAIVMVFALIGLGTLMVSTFRYPSFKKIDLRQRWSYRSLLTLATFILVLVYRPTAFFLAIAIIYTSAGPLTWLIGRLRRGQSELSDPQELDAQEAP